MRSRKRFPVKYIIYAALFLATAVITFLSMGRSAEVAATMLMTGAKLPVVVIRSEQGNDYNAMHGYVCDIDESQLDTEVTPLPSDNRLTIAVDTYGENVKAISYKVRDSRDMTLIEDTKVETFTVEGDRVTAELKMRNLIIDEVYYILEISVDTDSYTGIKYYTRIISGDSYDVDAKLNFVKEFNSNVYDMANINKIAEHIEPNSKADNSNFGKVNIYNSQSTIGFGDMNPFVESKIIPSVYEIDEEIAIIAFDYTIGAENEFGEYDTFVVHEFYRIRQTSRGIYLLSFDRETTQLFDGKNDATTSGKIDMGIQPDSETEYLTDSNNENVFFVVANVLWSYDTKKNTFTRVFGFDSSESDNIRERYNNHDIKIIDVDEHGNSYFMVYGYMNRGVHEGKVGISLYYYNHENNHVSEKVFISLNVPYYKLKNNVGEIAYVNSDNAFVVSVDDTLYSVELSSKEVMTEVSGLKSGSYVVSSDRRIIGYVTEDNEGVAPTVRVFNVSNGTDYIIKAKEGEFIKPLGFIGTDFIYGCIRESDIYINENGENVYPAYEMYVINSSYETIKEYRFDNTYVIGVKVEGLRVILDRVKKENDRFTTMSADQLINKDENNMESKVYADTMLSNIRKIQQILVIPETYIDINKVAVAEAGIEYIKDNSLTLDNDLNGEGKYYVTGMGLSEGSYKDIEEAIKAADAVYGYVKDCDGNLIWKKFKKSSYSITSVSSDIGSYGDSILAARHIVENYLGANNVAGKVIVNGIDIKDMLTVVGMQHPLIARGYSGYIVITGYNSTEVTYIDAVTGNEHTEGITSIQDEISDCGNIYEVYYKK